MVKSGKNLNGASSSQNSPADGNNSLHCPVVLGLLVESHIKPIGEDLLWIEAVESDDLGVELKKGNV
jgi:hypothetical protein